MGAFWKHRYRVQQPRDLLIRVAVPEHWQRERRLGDEDVARHEVEGRTGRIDYVLVIARSDDAQAVRFHRDLRRAEDMARRVESHPHTAEINALTIADRLRAAGEPVAVTQPHQIERLGGRQHGAVAGACMIGVGMGDQRPLDRPGGVNVKPAALAAHAGRGRQEYVFGMHRCLR